MRLISRYYTGPNMLNALAEEVSASGANALVQVFCSSHDPGEVRRLIADIQARMPSADVVGMTSYGTILDDTVSRRDTLITVLLPEQATIRCAAGPALAHDSENSKALGQELAQRVADSHTRCLLVLTNYDGVEPGALLEGVQLACPGIPVAGGQASTDPDNPAATLVWCNHTITDCGAVVVSLGGEQLEAWQDFNLGAAPMGRGLQVTRCLGNWVSELDDTPVLNIYRRYLGSDVTDSLPRSIVGFPLVVERQGTMIALDAMERSADGALRYSIPLYQGETVYFAFPHVERMIKGAFQLAERLRSRGTAEVLLAYTCASHLWTLEDGTGMETAILKGIAPLAGCLTSGEFSTLGKVNQHLNQSMTVLMLRENTQHKAFPRPAPAAASLLEANQSVRLRTVTALHGLVSRMTDELASANHHLQKERTFYRTLIEEMLDGLSLIDARGNCKYQSPSNFPIHGWAVEELKGSNFIDTLVHPDDRPMMRFIWQRLVTKPGGRERLITRLKHRDGQWITLEMQFRNCLDMPEVHAVVTYFRDITELKRLETELRRLATTDDLTRLANRRFFLEHARQEQRRAARSRTDLSMLILDVDHFKDVNDTYGHAAGDRVLTSLAELMQRRKRDQDMVGRLGGEELAILLPDTDSAGAVILAERLRAAVEAHSVEDAADQPLQITVSIGVACLPDGQGTIDLLMRQADEALYRAKREGRNRVFAAEQ